MQPVALYPGSFDPVTNGHVDVVRHAVRLTDKLVLAVGVNPGKAPLFSADERLAMLKDICTPLAREAKCELECVTFSGLVVEAARKVLDFERVYAGIIAIGFAAFLFRGRVLPNVPRYIFPLLVRRSPLPICFPPQVQT